MSIRDKILNIMADKLKKYQTPTFDVIPDKEVNKEIFQQVSKEKEKNETKNNFANNTIQVDGIIKRISREFKKTNGEKAKYIELEQRYIINDNVKYNTISIMIPSKLLVDNDYKENDIISVVCNLNNYIDKNNKKKSVINCYEIKHLEQTKKRDILER